MISENYFEQWLWRRRKHRPYQSLAKRLHIDMPLLCGLVLLAMVGLVILYSASGQNNMVLEKQAARVVISFAVMMLLAQVSPGRYQSWAPWLFSGTLCLLIAVLAMGQIGKGAQRWLDFGLFRFQPSELMKLVLPMMLAWYLRDKILPLKKIHLLVITGLTLFPMLLIAKQPDLGTALLIGSAGVFIIILAGISGSLFGGLFLLAAACAPVLWHFMHDYQRNRVLTFFNPERDPLGAGYHIIQSKIAIGSGGFYGKGWLNGTQSHLQFLPEHATDFIFAVAGEEFGLIGSILLLIIFGCIIARSLYISMQAQDTFSRLLAGSLSLVFFVSVFVNIGMVTGILPVVGIPLPLVSYGGTSMLTLMAGFGILMSIHTHRKLIST